MRLAFLLSLLLVFNIGLRAQLYFPPNNTSTWDTISPSDLGWCSSKIDSLYDLLETNNTKAFVLLVDGKIVLEKYFNGHNAAANWYWASAGKTLTAFVTGMAQQENHLSIDAPTSTYLGEGWTDCTPAQEAAITVWHQLTMTSGLDDGVPASACTLDTCLQFLAEAGTRWAYHNAPYTLLDQVIEGATGQTLNAYTNQKVKVPTGMNGTFLPIGDNNVFFSTARSMARFGLLVLNKGNWAGNQVMTDTSYFHQMTTTSQALNQSYGYLWWLNGQNSFMVPQSQFVFNGSLNPNAPDDMFCGLGANGQFLNVVPSRNMVWIRMGDDPGATPVPFLFNDVIWQYINALPCDPLAVDAGEEAKLGVRLYPNPVRDFLRLDIPGRWTAANYQVISQQGQPILQGQYAQALDVSALSAGLYYLRLQLGESVQLLKFVKR